jgi:CxxC motif-containing protein
MVSVKTDKPIKKSCIPDIMDAIRAAHAEAPISIGDVLLENVCGSNIIATKNII